MMERLSDWFTLSKHVLTGDLSIRDGTGIIGAFEQQARNYFGTAHALAFMNGTAALYAAYFALGIQAGDEVIVPSFTWHATAMPLLQLGARPVFAEVDEKTYTLDPSDVEKRITPRTKAIVVVHLFGFPGDLDALMKICKKRNLKLVEDGSHAFGAEYRNRKIGSFGDVSCFSMQQSKGVKAGEGGLLLTNDREMYERALLFGHPGRLEKEIQMKKYQPYIYTGLGVKLRPHPLSIALAAQSLSSLDRRNANIREIFHDGYQALSGFYSLTLPLILPQVKLGSMYGFHFCYRGKNKKKFMESLIQNGVPIEEEEFHLLHREPVFHVKADIMGAFPVTEKLHADMMCLPFPDDHKKFMHHIHQIKRVLSS